MHLVLHLEATFIICCRFDDAVSPNCKLLNNFDAYDDAGSVTLWARLSYSNNGCFLYVHKFQFFHNAKAFCEQAGGFLAEPDDNADMADFRTAENCKIALMNKGAV